MINGLTLFAGLGGVVFLETSVETRDTSQRPSETRKEEKHMQKLYKEMIKTVFLGRSWGFELGTPVERRKGREDPPILPGPGVNAALVQEMALASPKREPAAVARLPAGSSEAVWAPILLYCCFKTQQTFPGIPHGGKHRVLLVLAQPLARIKAFLGRKALETLGPAPGPLPGQAELCAGMKEGNSFLLSSYQVSSSTNS